MIGIYKITNNSNGKCYIGQSKDIEKRWRQHKSKALINQSNYPLYKAFKKYGVENFTFEVLEECELEQLDEKEIAYIEKFNSFNNGYNQTTGGKGFGSIEDLYGWAHFLKHINSEKVKFIVKPAIVLSYFIYISYWNDQLNAWMFSLEGIKIKDICKTLDMSESTFHKAFEELEKLDFVKRIEKNEQTIKEKGKNGCYILNYDINFEIITKNTIQLLIKYGLAIKGGGYIVLTWLQIINYFEYCQRNKLKCTLFASHLSSYYYSARRSAQNNIFRTFLLIYKKLGLIDFKTVARAGTTYYEITSISNEFTGQHDEESTFDNLIEIWEELGISDIDDTEDEEE